MNQGSGDMLLQQILYRDQRTAKPCIRGQTGLIVERTSNCYCCKCVLVNRDDATVKTEETSRNTTLRYQKFTKFLVIGVLLAVSISNNGVYAAPVNRRSMMERNPDVSPKWINPCGISSNEEDDVVDDGGMHTLTDAELIDQIVVQAKNAFSEARGFRDEYVQKTFNMDFEGHHKSWQDNHYKWLPELPKNLGEELPSDFLDTLTFDNTLVDTFEHLQRFAVGLEQVLWDLEDEAHETKAPVKFLEDFRNAWFKLRAVLCELQVAMIERSVAQKPDVTRDIMAQEYREMNGDITFRNIRDWLIFRDYMNTLEYVVQVFEHFKRICNGSQCPRSF